MVLCIWGCLGSSSACSSDIAGGQSVGFIGELPVWRHLQLQAISRRLTLGLYASFVWVLAALVAWCVFYACVYGLSVDELLVGAVFYWGFAVVTVVQLLVLLGVISLARVK